MPKVAFTQKKFTTAIRQLIEQANEILEQYAEDDILLTLRGLHYQLVSHVEDYPNTLESYNRLKSAMNDARWAGLVDWSHLQDQTRYLRALSTWDDHEDMLRSAANSFRLDKWANQQHRIEVWVEKDAVLGIVGPVCEELEVPYFSTRGYPSASSLWIARGRILRYINDGKCATVLYLGDHDPSGVHITRDVRDRLRSMGCHSLEVERLALTIEQVDQYQLAPKPAKGTDARFEDYVARTGSTDCWELDALPPNTMRELIRDRVYEFCNRGMWNQDVAREGDIADDLQRTADNWPEVSHFLDESGA